MFGSIEKPNKIKIILHDNNLTEDKNCLVRNKIGDILLFSLPEKRVYIIFIKFTYLFVFKNNKTYFAANSKSESFEDYRNFLNGMKSKKQKKANEYKIQNPESKQENFRLSTEDLKKSPSIVVKNKNI